MTQKKTDYKYDVVLKKNPMDTLAQLNEKSPFRCKKCKGVWFEHKCFSQNFEQMTITKLPIIKEYNVYECVLCGYINTSRINSSMMEEKRRIEFDEFADFVDELNKKNMPTEKEEKQEAKE